MSPHIGRKLAERGHYLCMGKRQQKGLAGHQAVYNVSARLILDSGATVAASLNHSERRSALHLIL